MKRLFFLSGIVLLAGLAFAAGPTIQKVRWSFLGGLSIGSDLAPNRITNHRICDIDYDFPAATIVANDSAAASCPGVKVGDSCSASFGPRDGGVQIVTANIGLNAFSDAVNTVKVRAFPVGTAANPVDAGYVVECFSSQ